MPAEPAMRGHAASRPRPVAGAGMSGIGIGAGSGDGQGGGVSRPLYRLSVQIIGRGRDGVAAPAAAYRSRSRLHDRDRDRSFCFADSDDLVHRSILAPEDAPAWARDREDLWNAVEAAETRCDSTLAREVLVALPRGRTKRRGRTRSGPMWSAGGRSPGNGTAATGAGACDAPESHGEPR